MRFQIQARAPWSDRQSSAWVPAVSGTLNQTGGSDEEASTFDARTDAEDALIFITRETGQPYGRFRIVELDRLPTQETRVELIADGAVLQTERFAAHEHAEAFARECQAMAAASGIDGVEFRVRRDG